VHSDNMPLASCSPYFVLIVTLFCCYRQPFLTDVATGKPSLIPAYNEIANNFLVANYGAGFGVDNDDTSSYYKIHGNFMYLGGGVKCDYDGHEKRFYNNLMLGTTAGCWHTCAYKKGYPDYCYNNTMVQAARPDTPCVSSVVDCAGVPAFLVLAPFSFFF
jgi:hypothetical protein